MTRDDAAAWSNAMSGFFFAANDGVNGCELHVHHPELNTTSPSLTFTKRGINAWTVPWPEHAPRRCHVGV